VMIKRLVRIAKKIRKHINFYGGVLNEGERYEPDLSWEEPCHMARYEFACQHVTPADTVLDIACGTGYGTKILASRCTKTYGVDISDKALAFATHKYNKENIEFIQSDIFSNKIIADVVVSFETIEHVKAESLSEILSTVSKYATKKLIGSIPYDEEQSANKYHYWYGLKEIDLAVLCGDGKLSYYYQLSNGEILYDKPDSVKIQNLIFVLEKPQQ